MSETPSWMLQPRPALGIGVGFAFRAAQQQAALAAPA
jgi:hypothetical protein